MLKVFLLKIGCIGYVVGEKAFVAVAVMKPFSPSWVESLSKIKGIALKKFLCRETSELPVEASHFVTLLNCLCFTQDSHTELWHDQGKVHYWKWKEKLKWRVLRSCAHCILMAHEDRSCPCPKEAQIEA